MLTINKLISDTYQMKIKPGGRDYRALDCIPVLEQCEPDTEFSQTLNPNPETPEAYVMALEYAKKNNADIVITTDPDCDRLGVAVKHNGG